ncbi:MAG: DUF4268 domain-containing protein [Fuerstiella sp.]
MTINLGKLTTVNPRDAWPHEASDFTPWLAQPENLQMLGDELELDLELVGTEVAVGPFSADILAKDTINGRNVVIENQLEKTDHDHLGKALTYGAILDASVVVWIAKHFTDEHRKTLDWLNDHTDENLELFGVCIEVWKVGDSLPAPRLNVVSRPAGVVKQARGRGLNEELSDTKRMQREFWTEVRDSLQATGKIPSLRSPRPAQWFDVALGRAGIVLSSVVNTLKNQIGVRVYLNHKVADVALEQLESDKDAIHKEIGCELTWNPNPDKRDKIISIDRSADLTRRDQWDDYVSWITEKVVTMRAAFHPRAMQLDLSARPPENDDD